MFHDPKQLRAQLQECLSRDRHRFKQQLDRLAKGVSGDATANHQHLADLVARMEISRSIFLSRKASVPHFDYPELPVSERKEDILAALIDHQVIVVCGETGSGKTTQLPKLCLEAGRGASGWIGHTQPRRIAARTVAARIAEELGEKTGQTVGYKVRFQDQTRPEALIKLMTDGILLAETQQDPYLSAYDTLIVDEAHERSLNIDFLLGYIHWLLPKRPDLKVIITSATIDSDRFSRHFHGAPVLNVSGRTFPVEIRYRPPDFRDEAEEDETDSIEQAAILDAVDELWREEPGDILVFLSGEREIRETAELLRKHHGARCEVLPLFARLSQSEQEKVFKPQGQRRIVLATNVAETSLTVPGIRSVIDTGKARISRYSHRSRLQRLPIEPISKASANQRSGRCGRLGPGIAIRLYSEQDFLNRPDFTDPEILRTNLAAVILKMHALKLGDISRFPFLEPPDERMVRDGLKTLQELNALDERFKLTTIGQRLSKLPLDPRLGRMILAAAEEGCLTEIAIIVSALSVVDPRERPLEKSAQADQKHARFKDDQSDFLALLKLWNDFEEQRQHLSNAKLRQYAKASYLNYVRMREWHDIHGQVMDVIKGELALKPNMVAAGYPEIHRALLSGLLSHICLRQEQNEYTGTRGGKLFIHPGSFLFKVKPKWLVAAEQVETSRVYARTVAKLEPEWIERVGRHLVRYQYYEPHWERKAARVAVHERTQLFGLTIQSGRKIPYERVDPKEARTLFIRHALVLMDYDSRAPFFESNLRLLEAADYLQQKGRRVDLLVDEAWLFDFFDARIPETVVSGVTFEKWRKGAEAQNPALLTLTENDITARVDESLDQANFPDFIQVGPLRVDLRYRFEPGHEDDGVTALIPIHLLNTLDPEPFHWLVPGMLREKLIALIKCLPKTLRIHFVPVPEHADRVLPMLDFGEGKLHERLSWALKRTGGIAVSPTAFREELVPDHLKVNFALIDENQTIMDRSRDLEQLKARHQKDAGENFKVIASKAFLETKCLQWTFGPVPKIFDGELEGKRVFGYPAVVDEGQSVGVNVFESPDQALIQHERGLVRLARLALSKDVKYLRKHFSVDPMAELAYVRLPAHPMTHEVMTEDRVLKEDMIDRLIMMAFLDCPEKIRDAEAFDQCLKAGRVHLMMEADRLLKGIQRLFQEFVQLKPLLNGLPAGALKTDVEKQLQLLMYRGFLITTPFAALSEYPRYLKAILHRLQKAPQDPQKDFRLLQEIAPYMDRYWQSVSTGGASRQPEREPFRWQLEEFRVSLFAQQLKTAVPVSAKRMAEAFAQLEAETKSRS